MKNITGLLQRIAALLMAIRDRAGLDVPEELGNIAAELVEEIEDTLDP